MCGFRLKLCSYLSSETVRRKHRQSFHIVLINSDILQTRSDAIVTDTMLGPIHTAQKRKFSLMFVAFLKSFWISLPLSLDVNRHLKWF